MMTHNQIEDILKLVQFRDWTFRLIYEGCERTFLQVTFTEPCIVTGTPMPQHGRKWLISPHMTRSEIVQTAFKAVLTALEHEAREAFSYKGKLVYGPHFDVEALAAMAASGATDARQPHT